MAKAFLIGVDIGTQGTKAALFDVSGRCLAQAFEASRLRHPAPGAVEEDPERQYGAVCRTVKRCVGEAQVETADVAALAVAGQMAGIIGVGDDGRAVTPYDSWLDTRCGPQIAQMNDRAGEEIVRRTGGPASFNHGPKILWWKKERPKVYRQIRTFVQPSGYAAMRLCGLAGEQAFIDWTYLHFSGFADTAAGVWDAGLCREFDVAQAKLPTIVAPQTVVGKLTASAGRRCGLKKGTPVVAGLGDTAASFLACGAVAPGVSIDVAGTASVFAATTDAMKPDVAHGLLSCSRSAVPGLWHPYAYINGGGMNLEWFRREIAGAGSRTRPGWDALERMASEAKSDDLSPMFVPHLAGRVSPPQPALRGAWSGLTHDHTLGHLYRAVLEGVALEYGLYRRVLAELYPRLKLKELRITGGGERSKLWNRIKADVLGVPVRRITDSLGAPLGVAMLAGWGVGLLPSLPQAAAAWVRPAQAVQPDRQRLDYYRRRMDVYQSLLARLDLTRS
jgi:xylulokinase